MATLAGLAIVLLAVVGLSGQDTAADEIRSHFLPAQAALQNAADHTARAEQLFETALVDPDRDSQAEALAATQVEARESDAAWSEYRSLAYGGPEERALQRERASLHSEAAVLGTAILGLDVDDPAWSGHLDELRGALAEERDVLAAIDATVYQPIVRQRLVGIRDGVRDTRRSVIGGSAALVVLFSGVGLVLLRGARREQAHMTAETLATRDAGEMAAFEGAFQRGLELASTEDATYEIVKQALSIVAPDVSSELLLADSSRAHFRQVLSIDDDQEAACRVAAPGDCPAAKSGQTRVFEDSTRLDACRFLRGRDEPVWAVCVPVSIAGQSIGVVHAQQELDHPPPAGIDSGLELVTRKAGERIGAMRVLARTEVRAQVDPLTGLPNRRTLEEQVLALPDDEYVVAFADLDHFKEINDGHGHETGDRALRLFARILRDAVRPRDLIGRFGGEEFVAVLPDCSLEDAKAVGERLRADLAAALDHGVLPMFTVTIGLAKATDGETLASTVARADVVMLSAKSQGRDRVLAEGDPTPNPGRDLAAVPSAG